MKHHDEDFDDDPLDENGLLKDGCSIRVPLMMRDSLTPLQRAVAGARLLHDGGDPLSFNRPGFRMLVDALARDASEEARAASIREMCDAWKTKDAAPPAGAYPLRAGEGRVCTIDGVPGTSDARSTADVKQAAYDAYCDDLQNAWRARA